MTVLKSIFWHIVKLAPYFNTMYYTRATQTPVTFRLWFWQKIVGFNRRAYWPVHHSSIVTGITNIYCGIETSPGYMPGCYIQGSGKIYIGDYSQISANVGIISSNHDITDNRKHSLTKQVSIGRYCWIGMNSVILPGVTLGDYTIVGAGSIVTKSFEDGYCVIAGNPARQIRSLDPQSCVNHRSEHEYNGYIPSTKFADYCTARLNVGKDSPINVGKDSPNDV